MHRGCEKKSGQTDRWKERVQTVRLILLVLLAVEPRVSSVEAGLSCCQERVCLFSERRAMDAGTSHIAQVGFELDM